MEQTDHAQTRRVLQAAYRMEAAGLFVLGLTGLATDVHPSLGVRPVGALVLLGAGAAALVWLLSARRRPRGFRLPQLRMHLAVGALLVAAGLTRVYRSGELAFVALGALALAGAVLLVHTQHGSSTGVRRAAALRIAVGGLLTVGAVLAASSLVITSIRLQLGIAGDAVILAAGVLAFAYREPLGAFATADVLRTHYMAVDEVAPGGGR